MTTDFGNWTQGGRNGYVEFLFMSSSVERLGR
jgi:hypothetical protein